MLTEVVYVLMKTYDGNDFMCTGTLVAKDRVLTAAHCLEPDMFESWEIVAPLAPRQPRVRAGNPSRFGGDYERPDQPDIGILRLQEPIDLPHYAELTDITSRVERGEKLTAVTIVRTDEELEAPFTSVDNLQLRSARELGYTFGFATQQFSKGGDSGAGLFLTENGHTTHKLVAVARNPEPKRQLDHFTRISPEFLKWLADGADTGTGATTTRD